MVVQRIIHIQISRKLIKNFYKLTKIGHKMIKAQTNIKIAEEVQSYQI